MEMLTNLCGSQQESQGRCRCRCSCDCGCGCEQNAPCCAAGYEYVCGCDGCGCFPSECRDSFWPSFSHPRWLSLETLYAASNRECGCCCDCDCGCRCENLRCAGCCGCCCR